MDKVKNQKNTNDSDAQEPHPPCVICGGPNDQAEICMKCVVEYFMLPATDLETSGGWMVQDYHTTRVEFGYSSK